MTPHEQAHQAATSLESLADDLQAMADDARLDYEERGNLLTQVQAEAYTDAAGLARDTLRDLRQTPRHSRGARPAMTDPTNDTTPRSDPVKPARLSIRLPADLAGRARTAWRASMSDPATPYLTFGGWIAALIEDAVTTAETRHNNGRAFIPTPPGVIPHGQAPAASGHQPRHDVGVRSSRKEAGTFSVGLPDKDTNQQNGRTRCDQERQAGGKNV